MKIENSVTLLFLLFWHIRREGKTAKAARLKGWRGLVIKKDNHDEIFRD